MNRCYEYCLLKSLYNSFLYISFTILLPLKISSTAAAKAAISAWLSDHLQLHTNMCDAQFFQLYFCYITDTSAQSPTPFLTVGALGYVIGCVEHSNIKYNQLQKKKRDLISFQPCKRYSLDDVCSVIMCPWVTIRLIKTHRNVLKDVSLTQL